MNRRTLLSFLTLTPASLLVASAKARPDELRYDARTLRGEGRAYKYTLFVPQGLRRTKPTSLIVLCGGSSYGRSLVQSTGLDHTAQASGVLIAVPQGDPPPLSRLIAEVGRDYAVDAGRVFVVGWGEGAGDAWALSSSEKVAAVAIVAANPALPSSLPKVSRPASFLIWTTPEQAVAAGTLLPLSGFAKLSPVSFGPHKTGAVGQIRATSFNGDIPDGDKDISGLVWDFLTENARTRTELKLQVTNLRSDRGRVLVALFDAEDGFPDDMEKAIAAGEATIQNGKATITFHDQIAPGMYAAILFHDENGNEKLDSTFGFPSEGFGATNNPKFGFGPPKFAEACFRLTARGAEISEIKMVYLSGGK